MLRLGVGIQRLN